jgi:asparagine synthase (glutamine-hydrolysing)
VSTLTGWFEVPGGGPQGPARQAGSRAGATGHTGPEGRWGASGPQLHVADDGLTAVVAGHPRWADPSLQGLADERGDAEALCAAFRRLDARCVEVLRDGFAVLLIDPAVRRLFAAVDRIGQSHLYYCATGGGLACASRAGALRAFPGVHAPLSPQAVHDYVFFHMVPSPGSAFVGVHKLPGAHALDFQDGELGVRRYWMPRFEEDPGLSVQDLGVEMRGIIEDSVRRYATPPRVGAFLSGGLDSSTVAGMLARVRPDSPETFSIGFAAEGYDEIPFARVSARHFGTHQHEHYVTPEDVLGAVRTLAAACDEPFGNASIVPAYYCARLARGHGVERLLGGDGGDEIFAGNERYAKQATFELYARLPRALRNSAGAVLAGPRATTWPWPLRKLASYVEQATVPLPDRMDTYNFLRRNEPGAVFEPELLARVDPLAPTRLAREVYGGPEQASFVNRMLYLDWHRTLHDNDLVKVNTACETAGVEVVYPLLDDALVDLACRVPTRWKLRGRRLRWFYREAVRGFLPEETLRKRKQGFGLPFGVWTRTHPGLQELASSSLVSLGRRGFFRPDFLERALALHREGHAAYYGELVWVLTSLELWLQAHPEVPGAGQGS